MASRMQMPHSFTLNLLYSTHQYHRQFERRFSFSHFFMPSHPMGKIGFGHLTAGCHQATVANR